MSLAARGSSHSLASVNWFTNTNCRVLWDFASVGGLSLLVFAFLWLRPLQSDASALREMSWILAGLLVYPHFAASWRLIYIDERHLIFRNGRVFFAAVINPVLLLGLVAWGLISPTSNASLVIGSLGAFLTFWHYSKQFYGVAIHFLRKGTSNILPRECLLIKYSLISTWLATMTHIFSDQKYATPLALPHIQFPSMPPLAKQIVGMGSNGLVGAGIITLVFIVMRSQNRLQSMIGAVALTSGYLWLVPGLQPSHFVLFMPAFHSIQYLTFAAKRHTTSLAGKSDDPTNSVLRYLLVVCLAGIGIFYTADQLVSIYGHHMGRDPIVPLAYWLSVANIHHYFVDAALWRRGSSKSTETRRWLVPAPSP